MLDFVRWVKVFELKNMHKFKWFYLFLLLFFFIDDNKIILTKQILVNFWFNRNIQDNWDAV